MEARGPAALLAAFAAWAAVASPALAETLLDATGEVGPERSGDYIDLPFVVPAGVTSLHVAFGRDTIEGGSGGIVGNTLDIGLLDPAGFRGWSGGARSEVTVSQSAAATTPGYLPGEIVAGTWQAEVGVALVGDGTRMRYSVRVEAASDPVADPYGARPTPEAVRGARPARVVRPGPGWYKGDLHCHSLHSDGNHPPRDVASAARAAGLEFLALTDHNTWTHQLLLAELQEAFPDIALLAGQEITTYRGHANVWGAVGPLDFHATREGWSADALLQEVRARGGMISVNHPTMVGQTAGGRQVSIGWTVPGFDPALADAMEVVNGPSRLFGAAQNPFNDSAIALWAGLLARGRQLVAVGGSDDHRAGVPAGMLDAPIGTPTTVVYAPELSERGILEGLRAGHVVLMTAGAAGPELRLEARSCDGRSAMPGDTLAAARATVSLHALRAAGRTLRLFRTDPRAGTGAAQGRPAMELVGEWEVGSDDATISATALPESAGRACFWAELRDGPVLDAMTNPVTIEPGGPACDEDGCGCTSPAPGAALLLFGVYISACRRVTSRARRREPPAT